MPVTTDFKNLLAAKVFGNRSDAEIPATYYIGLSTTAKTDEASAFTEPTGNGYARVALTNASAQFTEPVDGIAHNAANIEFPESTGAWGTVLQAGLFDSATDGKLLIYDDLTESRVIEGSGITLFFKAGEMDFAVGDIVWPDTI